MADREFTELSILVEAANDVGIHSENIGNFLQGENHIHRESTVSEFD